jgi:Flp pilus assembly protein TadG
MRRRTGGDDGMVTAELAAALPVLVLVMLVAVLAVSVAQARVRCADAAREAARAVARGESARAAPLAAAAAGRAVTVTAGPQGADLTSVTVRMQLRPVLWLGSMTVSETAVAATEPTAVGAAPS